MDLRRLPDNVVRNIVRNLEPGQLLPMSLTSRRFYELITSIFTGAFVWTFDMFREAIYVQYQGHRDEYLLINLDQMNRLSPMLANGNAIDPAHPHNERLVGNVNMMQTWIGYTRSLFASTTISYFVSDGSEIGFLEKFGLFISWFEESRLFVERCEINGSLNNDSLDMVLHNLGMIRSLKIDANLNADYRFNGEIVVASLEIVSADFVTLLNAWRMRCTHIALLSTNWTPHQCNQFFKHFVDNENRVWQWFYVTVGTIDVEVLLEGIRFETRNRNLVRYHKEYRGAVNEIRGGVDIRRRIDGVKGTIFLEDDDDMTHITLIVWQGENARVRNEHIEEINPVVQERENVDQ